MSGTERVFVETVREKWSIRKMKVEPREFPPSTPKNGGFPASVVTCGILLVEMAILRSWTFGWINWSATNMGTDGLTTPPTTIGLFMVVAREGWPVLGTIAAFAWFGYDIVGLGLAVLVGYPIAVSGGSVAGAIATAIAAYLFDTQGRDMKH